MKPSDKYQAILEQPEFFADAGQNQAIALLDDLYTRLQQQSGTETGWLKTLLSSDLSKASIKGLYFWGGVGRGKTFLMDIFYQSLPNDDKQRVHFHDFMNQIHSALKKQSSLENPLHKIAEDLAEEFSILCLDEFVITDIGDAMIMACLLEALFEAGVVLVTTSNTAPQNLYHDGLQRARFLPAIDLVCRHCDVVNLDGGEDYRLKGLQQTDLYTVPHSLAVNKAIQLYLDEHVTPIQAYRDSLCINTRQLSFQVCAEDTVWFNFEELCKTTRSQNDYLELARLFNTLILTDIEIMSAMQDDIARRFVLLIDVMYDHRVKLICSAEAKAEHLYKGKRLAFEFERTSSRLIEMQSQQYLTQAHTQQ
ncbi:MAG: cell division protein ZapE [Gammaproteobacteria bacterium]|nr:cell division protein ZapE [Gammaproteobacteria bacterium]